MAWSPSIKTVGHTDHAPPIDRLEKRSTQPARVVARRGCVKRHVTDQTDRYHAVYYDWNSSSRCSRTCMWSFVLSGAVVKNAFVL